MIFDNLKELVIPEGNVIRIEHAGKVLWEKIIYTIQTITGINSITIPEVANYKGGIVEITQYGKAEQDDTPTPSTPVDIKCNNGVIKWGVSGTNLLDMAEENIYLRHYINDSGEENSNNQNFYNTKFISVKPNTTYTLFVSQPVYYLSIMEHDSNKGFLQRILDGNSNEKHSGITFRTSADTAYILIGSNPNRTPLSMDDVTSINWMLNEGSAALPYEPYTEGVIADGTPEVLSVGGNLLSRDGETTGKIINSDGTVSENTNYCISTPFTLSAGNYICTWQTGSGSRPFSVFAVDESGMPQSDGKLFYKQSSVSGINTGKFTVDAETLAVASYRFNVTELSIINTDVQTASVADLFAVGDYKDEQDIIHGVITRRVGVKVLDGTENWGAKNATSGQIITRVNDMLNQSSAPLMVTHGEWSASATKDSDEWRIVVGPYLACFSSQETTADFKAWLADQYAQGTPVIVVYPLAEEITESATPQTITANGTTAISTDSNYISDISLKVDYYGINE